MNLKVSEEHAVQLYMAAQQKMKKFVHEHGLRNRPRSALAFWCMAFRLGCMHTKYGVQNISKQAVSSKANCKKGSYAP
eukprot:998539-Pelagomonas_calceolata.AAC.4